MRNDTDAASAPMDPVWGFAPSGTGAGSSFGHRARSRVDVRRSIAVAWSTAKSKAGPCMDFVF